VVTLFLGAGALNSQNNLLFLAFGGAIGVLVVSGLLSGSMLMAVQARREEVEPGEVGRPCVVRYTVRNSSRFLPAFALSIGEAAGGEATWSGRISRPAGFVAYLGPGRETVVEAPGVGLRRGEVTLDRFRVSSSFPFGVATKSVEFRAIATGIVRAAPIEAQGLNIEEARGAARRGRAARRSWSGANDEFLSLREYVPGDSLRGVAWRASARRGELVVRELGAPAGGEIWILLELGAPGDAVREAQQETAIGIAAHAVEMASAGAEGVGLAVPAAGVWVAARAPGGGRSRRREELLDALARIDLSALDPEREGRAALPSGVGVVRVASGERGEEGLRAPVYAPEIAGRCGGRARA
jgi:uncharacterized protein (DUF58 family)